MHRVFPICLALVIGCKPVSGTSPATNPGGSSAFSEASNTRSPGTSNDAPLAGRRLADAKQAAKGGNEFAFDVFEQLRESDQGNLFFSPYSIYVALAMTSAGAAGTTADELSGVLHNDIRDLHGAVAALAQSLRAGAETDGYELNIANRLWGQEGYEFLADFLALTRDQYGAELTQLDFATDAETARGTINGWVEDETRQKIRDLLQPGDVDDMTRLVLTNAIYFKGQWNSKFDERFTSQAPFHLSSGDTIDVPLMYQAAEFKYHAADGMQMIELPYGEGLSMVVMLPDKNDGLPAIEARLTSETVEGWLSHLAQERVMVHLPRFNMTSQFALAKVLRTLGLSSAFTPGEADLSGMTGSKELFLSTVIHKAFVDVNEEGTEAAAATAVVARTPGPPVEVKIFRAEHPFLFLIRDNRTGSIVFLGRVMNPKS
jgi:serpin B